MKQHPFNSVRSARRFILFVGLYGWSVTVAAAALLGPDLVSLPWAQVAVGTAISLWGGLTRTAERGLSAKQTQSEFHAIREGVKDGMAAILLGGITYLLGAWQQLDIYLLGAALGLGGYVGTPLLSRLGEAWSSKLISFFGKNKDEKDGQ